MTDPLRRYLRGWFMYARAVYKMRTKKHGAGAQPLVYCHRMGMCARYIVDGQHRRGKPPGYLKACTRRESDYLMEKEIQQHLGRLRGYLAHMTENNWRDLALRCERQLNDLERAIALQAIDDVLKHDRRLVAQRERRWCKSCGTVTRTDECDCTTFEATATAQNLVNYADAILEDREELIAQRDALVKALEPFAQEANRLDGVPEDYNLFCPPRQQLEAGKIVVADLRRARAAIKATREGNTT